MGPESSFPEKADLQALRWILHLSEDDGCVVYFLCSGPEVVYVGSTVRSPSVRVSEHCHQGKIEFDDVLVQPCKRTDRLVLEREFDRSWRGRRRFRH
jgi:hypothetical protein